MLTNVRFRALLLSFVLCPLGACKSRSFHDPKSDAKGTRAGSKLERTLREEIGDTSLRDWLLATVKTRDVRTVEELLPLLPEELRRYFILVYKSRSTNAQTASFETPRILLASKDGSKLLAVQGAVAPGKRDDIELIELDPKTYQWTFHVLSLSGKEGKGPSVDDSSKACAACHSSRLRPISDSYPLWPGWYGGHSGALSGPSNETKAFEALVRRTFPSGEVAADNASKKSRYAALIGLETMTINELHSRLVKTTFAIANQARRVHFASFYRKLLESPERNAFLHALGSSWELGDVLISKSALEKFSPARQQALWSQYEARKVEAKSSIAAYNAERLARFSDTVTFDDPSARNKGFMGDVFAVSFDLSYAAGLAFVSTPVDDLLGDASTKTWNLTLGEKPTYASADGLRGFSMFKGYFATLNEVVEKNPEILMSPGSDGFPWVKKSPGKSGMVLDIPLLRDTQTGSLAD
jgi:hypothetical protein